MYVNGAEPDPRYYEERSMSDKFSGVIEKLFVKFNEKTKKQSISIINNSNFYGLGLYEDKFVKVGDVVLKEGMQVEFEYDPKKFKNVDMNTFKIIQKEVPKEVKKQQVDKNLAMRLGNALTISTHLTKSHSDLVVVAKQVLPMVDEFRNKMAEKHPEMDDFSVGSRAGQVCIVAAEFTANINDFISVAERLFEELCQAEEELKNASSNVQDKKENKVKTEKGVSKVKETKPESVVNDTTESEPEFDFDDIPF